jgi:hypothetical protein
MSTVARKAAFVAIMGADGVDDAVVRLGSDQSLRGAVGAREGVRVLVECCGAESSYNRYYAAVAQRLCAGDGGQRFTLQLSFWDVFKKLPTMPPRRALNLAQLGAALAAEGCLALPALLKGAAEGGHTLVGAAGTALLFFKAFFAYLMLAPQTPARLDPLASACAKLGAKGDALLIRDQVVVFVAAHLGTPLPGLSQDDAAAWPLRRKAFKRCLRDAQALFETQKALGKKGKDGKRAKDDTDIPDDEWAQFYEGGV